LKLLKLEDKLRLSNSKSVNPKKSDNSGSSNEALAALVRPVIRLKISNVLIKRRRREASK
jgi:hypothetical protein